MQKEIPLKTKTSGSRNPEKKLSALVLDLGGLGNKAREETQKNTPALISFFEAYIQLCARQRRHRSTKTTGNGELEEPGEESILLLLPRPNVDHVRKET